VNKPKTLCSICKNNPCEFLDDEGELPFGSICPDFQQVPAKPPYCPNCGLPLTDIVESYQGTSSFAWNPDRKIYEEYKQSVSEAERTCGFCGDPLKVEEDEFFLNNVQLEQPKKYEKCLLTLSEEDIQEVATQLGVERQPEQIVGIGEEVANRLSKVDGMGDIFWKAIEETIEEAILEA